MICPALGRAAQLLYTYCLYICLLTERTLGNTSRLNGLECIVSFRWDLYKWVGGTNITPLHEMMPGQIPGFLGCPHQEQATITEEWGPLRVTGNIPPFCTVGCFRGPSKDRAVTEEQQSAAPTVARPYTPSGERSWHKGSGKSL